MFFASSRKASRVPCSLACAALILAGVSAAEAADGLFLPNPPNESGGEDSITTPSGLSCRQSLNRGGPILDLGVGAIGGAARGDNETYRTRNDDGTAIAYARIVIPLGERPPRIDCSRIYLLEIERLKREIELLDAAIE